MSSFVRNYLPLLHWLIAKHGYFKFWAFSTCTKILHMLTQDLHSRWIPANLSHNTSISTAPAPRLTRRQRANQRRQQLADFKRERLLTPIRIESKPAGYDQKIIEGRVERRNSPRRDHRKLRTRVDNACTFCSLVLSSSLKCDARLC